MGYFSSKVRTCPSVQIPLSPEEDRIHRLDNRHGLEPNRILYTTRGHYFLVCIEADILLIVLQFTGFSVFSDVWNMALSYIKRSFEYFGSTFLLEKLDAVNWQTHATIASKFVIPLMLRRWIPDVTQAPKHIITEYILVDLKVSFFSLLPLHSYAFGSRWTWFVHVDCALSSL